jgi:ribosomal protein S18 acetylase RimI-like enzyme
VSTVICLHTKKDVEEFCRKNPFLHLYSIGDLDDFFWPHTIWFALQNAGQVRQLVLFYTDLTMRIPALLALAESPVELMRELLGALLPVLPRRFYAHLSENTANVFADDYRVESHGRFHKMGLIDDSLLAAVDATEAVALTVADTPELLALYGASYPGNWFVPRMLQTGFYFGVRRGGKLLSVAGVHVYSPPYRVAALGNITTRPDVRGKGLATLATARLCQELRRAGIESIGLNVKAENRSAVACYERLGFQHVADYGEYSVGPK